ncbi:Serine hydrolase FSH [Penicillium hispanicum]|uniref:Serine hydrolase FSH n=1 Tax=Penicillium hispanicum TaxID=1080232 RepID=UPI00254043D4|nr:Serine hydrolase FSH [Penicillium hispanicum]KAJ5578050.1 Serine hydrolase FSH [Penicillium hispanicum]
MKILMIHGKGTGSRQSGELFRAKLQALEKLLRQTYGHPNIKEIQFVYPTAPFPMELSPASSKLRDQHGAWTWFKSEAIDDLYPGLDSALSSIAGVLSSSGPFDGIVGFSEGGALAAMIASLLEDDRKNPFARFEAEGGLPYPKSFANLDHAPLKFVVDISGYAASNHYYRAFYEPKIQTPSLHFMGSMDSVVDGAATMRLIESCQESEGGNRVVISHPGGHVIPSGKRELASIVHFIKGHIKI